MQTKLSELWKNIQKHAGPQFQEAVKYVQTKWKQLLAHPQVFFLGTCLPLTMCLEVQQASVCAMSRHNFTRAVSLAAVLQYCCSLCAEEMLTVL